MKDFRDGLLNKHEGKKALVCGQGSSLDLFSKDFYENWDGFTVGVNCIKLLFVPDYWVAIDVMLCRVEDCKRQEWYTCSPQESDDWGTRNGRPERFVGSMGFAIACAFHLGASEIYLIGIDGGPNKDGEWHFKERREQNRNDLTPKDGPFLDKMMACLPDQILHFKVPIYNLSPYSALPKIPKITLKEKENG